MDIRQHSPAQGRYCVSVVLGPHLIVVVVALLRLLRLHLPLHGLTLHPHIIHNCQVPGVQGL